MSASKKAPSKIKTYVIYGGLGLSLCTEIAVAGLIGWWLGAAADQKFHMKPWGTLIGICFLVGASFFHILRVLQNVSDRLDREEGSN